MFAGELELRPAGLGELDALALGDEGEVYGAVDGGLHRGRPAGGHEAQVGGERPEGAGLGGGEDGAGDAVVHLALGGSDGLGPEGVGDGGAEGEELVVALGLVFEDGADGPGPGGGGDAELVAVPDDGAAAGEAHPAGVHDLPLVHVARVEVRRRELVGVPALQEAVPCLILHRAAHGCTPNSSKPCGRNVLSGGTVSLE